MKYLFVIGAQKAGTTYLYQLLKQHSSICVARFKELHFFQADREYRKGIENFKRKFDITEKTEYLADFTPSYIVETGTLEKIKAMFGDDAVIIVMLRDPIERAFSQYRMECSKRNEKRSFNELIKEELANEKKLRSFTGRGLYSEQLDRVFSLFKKENIQIIGFEDITTRTYETLERIYNFLNIDHEVINIEVEQNTTPDSRPRGIAGLYYRVPFAFRRKFYDFSPVFTEFLREKFTKAKRVEVNEAVLDDESKEMLSEFYKQSNKTLNQKYGIDTSKWI